MNHISAGIVLYNPEIERLKENADSINPQMHIIMNAELSKIVH
jgi:hypothetical protein